MKWRIPLIVVLLVGSFCWNNLNAQTKRLPSQIPPHEQPYFKKHPEALRQSSQSSMRARPQSENTLPSRVSASTHLARVNKHRPADRKITPAPTASRGTLQQRAAKLPSRTMKADKRSVDEFKRKRTAPQRQTRRF